MRYGFTATKTINEEGRVVMDAALAFIEDGTEFTTGACVGGDAYLGLTLVKLFPHAKHRVVVPANRKKVDYWWHPVEEWHAKGIDLEIVLMPAGTDYRDRNNRILDFTDKLLAFPSYPEHHGKSKRSGTWMTVRLAGKRNIETVSPFIFSELCTSSMISGNVHSMNDVAMERTKP